MHTQGQQDILAWRRLLLNKAKLKASSRTSGLMSGFAMVAMVEISLDPELPSALTLAFSLLTTCLISVHVFALMISVCILPNLETVEQTKYFELPETSRSEPKAMETHKVELPHENLRRYIQLAWIFSTGLGTLLFLLEIPVLLWVKLYKLSIISAIAASAVMVPVCITFVIFALHFHRKLVEHKYSQSTKGIEELQLIAKHLHSADGHEEGRGLGGVQDV